MTSAPATSTRMIRCLVQHPDGSTSLAFNRAAQHELSQLQPQAIACSRCSAYVSSLSGAFLLKSNQCLATRQWNDTGIHIQELRNPAGCRFELVCVGQVRITEHALHSSILFYISCPF